MKEKIKISINISGGNVQQILSNNPDIDLRLYDYDNAKASGTTKSMERAEKRFNRALKTYL